MGRKRKDGKKKGTAVEVYSSDDERAYAKEAVPDPNSEDFYFDDVDKFHNDEERTLLSKGAQIRASKKDIEEEEVLGVGDDSDDSEDEKNIAQYMKLLKTQKGFQQAKGQLDSDLEDESEDDEEEEIATKAWGSKALKFYGGDTLKEDVDLSGSEPDDAVLEEKAALTIQKRMMEQLDDQDFGFDLLETIRSVDDKGGEKIETDVSKLSRKEKIQLVKKESPELSGILTEYKEKLNYLRETLFPLLDRFGSNEFIIHITQLYIDYCVNISFYLVLKFQREDIRHHPVIDRICQYSRAIKDLTESMGDCELEELLERIDSRVSTTVSEVKTKKRKRIEKKSDVQVEESDDDEPPFEVSNVGGRTWGRKKSRTEDLSDDDEKAGEQEEEGERGEEAEEEDDGRRAINYTIAKNRGLTPHRKKENRNPRVKHRNKYRKAKISRRGQIREVRKETKKYDGEISGIKAGIKRSIKMK